VGGAGKKVLLLTNGAKTNVYLSGRNLPQAQVLPYTDATAYHVLWADVVVVEQSALAGGEAIAIADAKSEGRKAKSTAKKAATKAKAKAKAAAPKAKVAKAKTVKKAVKKAAAPKKASRKKESE